MYLFFVFGDQINSNNQSRATLWVLETCLIVGPLLLYDHLDHCFVIFKDVQHSFLTGRIRVWSKKINIVQIINLSKNFLSRWRCRQVALQIRQCSQEWSSAISEPIHSSTAEKNDNQTPIQNQRCQSGPSTKNSLIPGEGDSAKNYGAEQRLQISDPHFDKFPTPAIFACWKIRFKTEVCTCSQFPTDAMHWIKEVETVDSVDDLKPSSSVRRIRMPFFWSTRCEDCFSTEQNHP